MKSHTLMEDGEVGGEVGEGATEHHVHGGAPLVGAMSVHESMWNQGPSSPAEGLYKGARLLKLFWQGQISKVVGTVGTVGTKDTPLLKLFCPE